MSICHRRSHWFLLALVGSKSWTILFLKITTNLQPSPSLLKPSYNTLTPSLLSLSLFLRNYRCSKALFNLTLPSELKWLRTPLQVLRIWILIMIFWIILDWIFTFHQNLISLLFIILFWDFIFWSFELVFQWKIVSLFLGVFYFIWFFFMGLFMLCSSCFCCSVLAFVYFLTWNFSSLLIYRHVFGIRYLIRIKDLILYDCFYWHSVCKICFLYLKFCGGTYGW